jgi:hypothetical protein
MKEGRKEGRKINLAAEVTCANIMSPPIRKDGRKEGRTEGR